MLTENIKANMDRIREMGREEIAKAHAMGLSAFVSDRPGHIKELRPDGTVVELDDRGRETMVASARVRFEKATVDMAAEQRFGGTSTQNNEIDMMEEATLLTRAACER